MTPPNSPNGKILEVPVRVGPKDGFHLHPITQIVTCVQKHASVAAVFLRNGDRKADAQSPLDILTLGAGHGTSLTLEIHPRDGEDPVPVRNALMALTIKVGDKDVPVLALGEESGS